MSRPLDPTDVPAVAPEALDVPMSLLIERGEGLALHHGLDEATLKALEHDVWPRLNECPTRRLAVALRFRALVAVFRARRLKDMLLQNGFRTLAPALEIAATLRLNTGYGFSPARFATELTARLAALDAAELSPPRVPAMRPAANADTAFAAAA